jgi:hypothetical protein
MSISMSIHPNDSSKVDSMSAEVYGPGDGDCINICIENTVIHIHYGASVNQHGFISKFKEMIAALPNPCPTCGK